MVVLDSNIIITIMKGDKNILNFIKNNFNSISTTVINVYEIMRGKYNSTTLEDFLNQIIIYPLTIDAVKVASDIYKTLKSSGKIKSDSDILIASIVKANN
ncbi:type II toxin-antitoxin system VapC family toxin [Acidianus brierleyi]|uniref:type II toxin-antitoxin system VapC family toxin n=1 Tax=Acidianus brierleyi TaxID=41673 RepID=UPI001FE244CF|nr:type II toxin-antitoxin system VapC family toxin [Acidianus brierleyi]